MTTIAEGGGMYHRHTSRTAPLLILCLVLVLTACSQAAPTGTPLPTVTPIPSATQTIIPRSAASIATMPSARPQANVPTGGPQAFVGMDLHDQTRPTAYFMQWTEVSGSVRGQGDATIGRLAGPGEMGGVSNQPFLITGLRNGTNISLTFGIFSGVSGTLIGITLTLVIPGSVGESPYTIVLQASNLQEYLSLQQQLKTIYADAPQATATAFAVTQIQATQAAQETARLEYLKRVSGRWEAVDKGVGFNLKGGTDTDNKPSPVQVLVLNQDGTATFPGTDLPQAKFTASRSPYISGEYQLVIMVPIQFSSSGPKVEIYFYFVPPSTTEIADICINCTSIYRDSAKYLKK